MKHKMTNLNLHKKKWFIIFVISMPIVLIIAGSITGYYSDITREENYLFVVEHKINGKVIKISTSSGFEHISLNNETKDYEIATEPITNSEHDFYDFVEVGDSIRKNPNSDTLVILKDGKEYLYRLIRRWDYTR
jgi:hypothetical protein